MSVARPVRRVTTRMTTAGPVALCALLLTLLPLLVGCGSASQNYPPTGVDGLVIPTLGPDPDDFVEEVDNPWLGLGGQPRTYVTPGVGAARLVAEAAPGPLVDGVPTTAVRVDPASGTPSEAVTTVTNLYAQDAEGNVWWFGQAVGGAVRWRAGVDGARAGLVMAADPRVGDGYRTATLPGTEDPVDGTVERATVLSTDGSVTVGGRSYDDVVVLDVRTRGVRVLRSYVAGLGLVRQEPLEEPAPGDPDGAAPADVVPLELTRQPR